MKKIRRFASSMMAVMLAGTLTVGSLSVSAFGAEDTGSVESTSVETSFEEATEEVETGVSDSAVSDTSEIATEDDAITSYTVTLDANGGYFQNEWDDVLNETLEKTEILNKIVPVGEIVSTVPVYEQEGTTATFLGWSLERDGEILPQEQEGYVPAGDCVLFAVWKYDDTVSPVDTSGVIGKDGPKEESNDLIETEKPEASTPEEEFDQENNSEDVVIGETVSEENADEAPATYAVTLDANGGYFVNEWDDVLGKYVEHAEILNKVIPVEGIVAIVPVNKQDGISAVFLGWSLERDGEILSQEQEGYAPVGDCVLYAVWDFFETSIPDPDERRLFETDQTDSSDSDFKEDDAGEGPKENESLDNTHITESISSSAKNTVMYDSYEGIDYTKLTTNRKRIAALNKAKDMVTVTWVSPATFCTWYAFSSGGPYNSVIPEDGGASSQYFMQGKKYKGIPYTMYTVNGESPNRNAKDNIDWENIINNNTTSASLTAKYSGQDVPAYGIDCSSFVWRALQETGEKVSYYATSSMAASGYYKKIEWDNIKPGDILLKTGHNVGHVMMFVGRLGDKYAVFEATPPKTQYKDTYTKSDLNGYLPYTFIGYDKVDQIILSDSEMEIYQGDSNTIVATVMPDEATNKDVIWESDNERIVTVDQAGTIRGIAKGVATVTATAKDNSKVKASCVIKVKSGKIYSIQDLKDVSDDLSNSYILMNDLNLGNEEWTPIGTASNPFTGKFNGNGHTIKGLKIDSDSDYQGLFGMTSGASISRLKVSGKVKGKTYVAGIAGYASDSTFSYCINNASISGVDQVGGVVGRPARSPMTYCMNTGSVSATNRGSGGVAADIYPSGSISNSLNTGSISGGTDLTGGIVGGCTSGPVSGCINAAPVTYQRGRAGGIAGDNAYYAGSRSNNFFLQTAGINKDFKVIGSGSGTILSSSDSKVVDLRNKILFGFNGKKFDQNISVKPTAYSIAVGKTAKISIIGAKGKKSYKSSNTKIATVNASTGVVTGKKAGTVIITASSAETAIYNAASKTVRITVTLSKPGECRFTKWNNSKYTGCRISWNKVDGAEGYQTLLSWTNGSNSSSTITKSNVLYRDCSVHPQHVSQMKVRAFYTSGGKRVYGPWSNVVYITPSPTKLTTKNASTGSNLKMNVSWNIVYGCNGYNVFVTTNPNGKWYWNQSTSEKASATSATITKCGGSKLKKNTKYYVRIVTRRKRNGVFCTVPMPASNTYIGTFTIK